MPTVPRDSLLGIQREQQLTLGAKEHAVVAFVHLLHCRGEVSVGK